MDSRCAMTMEVLPSIRRSSASNTSFSEAASRPELGSSRIRIGVLRITARAMAIRWRWPPDKRDAAFAEDRVVAFAASFSMNSCALASSAARRISARARFGLAVSDVVPDRPVEQQRLLQHES